MQFDSIMETTYPQTETNRVNQAYFPPPYSIDPLPHVLQIGLIPVGLLATLSFVSTLVLLCFIIYRIVLWRRYYQSFVGSNQYVMLVLNLLLADLQQSSAFLISFHWIQQKNILAPTPACTAQGWLLHSGDVSSGFFVLAIAIHTFYTAVIGKRVTNLVFFTAIACIWIFSYFLTGLGLAMHGDKYFVRAGAWCWVSSAYEKDRLALHYIWIFMIEFGTILLYGVTFVVLRRKTSRLFKNTYTGRDAPNAKTVKAVNRITLLMMLYPCFYVFLTLPLSAGRMWTMAHGGESVGDKFACAAGGLLASCGWVDTALYTLTRKRLLKETMPGGSSRRSQPDELGSVGITHTRSVTVRQSDAPEIHHHGVSDSIGSEPHVQRNSGNTAFGGRSPSPTGSIDPILSGKIMKGQYKAETSVGLKEMLDEDDSEAGIYGLAHVKRTYR